MDVSVERQREMLTMISKIERMTVEIEKEVKDWTKAGLKLD